MDKKIIVIGAGISGITTAITLQLLDFDTEIYTDQTINQIDDKNAHSEFASLFPSASVIPHSVYSDQLKALFQLSQSTFYELRKQMFPGLTIHKHFEVFEFDPEKPDYCDWMFNFQPIDELDPDSIPRRPDSPELYGWVFDCLFADWTLYFPAIIQFYKHIGGQITHQKLERGDIDDLPSEIIINCSGTGSLSIFNDPVDKQLLMRGHLLHYPEAPLIMNSDNEIISYNYMPQASVYSDAEGKPCDVYCYPRKDGWILGGSRQAGTIKDNNWDQSPGEQKSRNINDIIFPNQIIDLNNEILRHTYDVSLDNPEELIPSVGLRYIRSQNNGLRLDHETISGKKVFHNYGHGGAGVTLSWGCALKIAEHITAREASSLRQTLLGEIENTKSVNSLEGFT